MLGVEAIRTAQEKFGKKPLTGEQVRWGLENLNLTAERLKQLGFENQLQPIKVSCADMPALTYGSGAGHYPATQRRGGGERRHQGRVYWIPPGSVHIDTLSFYGSSRSCCR
jgi:hypothetical protein